MKGTPSRKALEVGFLILSLLPRRTTARGTIKEAADKVAGLRLRVLPETGYRRCSEASDQPSGWRGFWRAYTSLEAPGIHADDELIVPEYPFLDPQDLNQCDLTHLSNSLWHGVRQFHKETTVRASAG